MALPCVCAGVRRLARLATRAYDEHLRPCGVEVGQFALLATIRRAPGVSQSRLAHGLDMDSTSLTRTLAAMLRRGWITKHTGVDRRSRVFTLTPAGQAMFTLALPHWREAQRQFSTLVGPERIGLLLQLVDDSALMLHRRADQRRRGIAERAKQREGRPAGRAPRAARPG